MEQSGNDDRKVLLEDSNETSHISMSVWKQRLLVCTLLSCQLTALCTDTFLYPFFPQKAKSKGLTDAQIGLVFSSFELSRFFCSLATGYLIGKFDGKIICLVASIASGLSCVCFGLITYAPDKVFFPLCVMLRLVAGSGAGTLSVSIMTVLIQATSYEPSTAVAITEAIQGAGFAIGPALGAGLRQLGGYNSMFWTLGAVLILLCIVQPFAVPSIKSETAPKKSSLNMLKIPGILLLSMHLFMYKVVATATHTGFSNFLINMFGVAPSTVGLVFGAHAPIYLFMTTIVTKVMKRGYIYSLILLAWGGSIIDDLFIGPSPLLHFIFNGHRSLPLTMTLYLMMGVYQGGVYVPPFQAAINLALVSGYDRDSVETYGMVAGLLNGGIGLGSMVGPILGGIITQHTDFTWTLTVLAGLGMVMLMTLSTYLLWMSLSGQPLSIKEKEDSKIAMCEEQTHSSEVSHQDESTEMETFPTGSKNSSVTELTNEQFISKLEHCLGDSISNCTTTARIQPG